MLRHGLQCNNPILFPAIGTSPFLVRNILCNLTDQFDKFRIRDQEFIMCCLRLVVLDFTQGTSYQLVRYSRESTSRAKTTMRGRQSCTPARCTGLARGLRVGIAVRFCTGMAFGQANPDSRFGSTRYYRVFGRIDSQIVYSRSGQYEY